MRRTYKRFIVFAGNQYCFGGLEDVRFTSDSVKETIEFINIHIEPDNSTWAWYNILDTSCNEEITLNDLKIYNKSVSQYE